jgi:ATP-dependent DNA ligase
MSALTTAAPMEAKSSKGLPEGDGWWFEPKWDGFRCLAFRSGDQLELVSKSGKSLNKFFPEVVERLKALPQQWFGLDGELLAQDGSDWSFEVLQARLHPAPSRIHRLSLETPATLVLFDMLVDVDGGDIRREPLKVRQARLAAFTDEIDSPMLTISVGTAERARAETWLAEGRLEGVVAKRLDGPYLEGERAMIKVKRVRSADCVVGGFRYASAGRVVGSLLLGLYDGDGRLNHVGFTSGFAGIDKGALTRQLEALCGGVGFTGRSPGGPSRWATERSGDWRALKPELVVEVTFDHVSDGRFRHGAGLLRFRPDKAPSQCRMEQLEQ